MKLDYEEMFLEALWKGFPYILAGGFVLCGILLGIAIALLV